MLIKFLTQFKSNSRHFQNVGLFTSIFKELSWKCVLLIWWNGQSYMSLLWKVFILQWSLSAWQNGHFCCLDIISALTYLFSTLAFRLLPWLFPCLLTNILFFLLPFPLVNNDSLCGTLPFPSTVSGTLAPSLCGISSIMFGDTLLVRTCVLLHNYSNNCINLYKITHKKGHPDVHKKLHPSSLKSNIQCVKPKQ